MKDLLMSVAVTTEGLARVEGDELVLVDLVHADLAQVLAHTGSLAAVTRAPARRRLPLAQAEAEGLLLAPVSTSSALWGVGLNYHSKAALTGRPIPTSPILYLAASSAISAPGQVIPCPADMTAQLDYEGEIGIVIGRRLSRARERDVWAHVAGITAANDMTARDVMTETATPTLAKSFDGGKPIGASVLAVEDVPDVDDIGVKVWVNGEPRQDGRSSGLIFSVPELIARISRYAVLEPGDVVLTGTPAGTGQDRRSFLGPGDTVTVSVEGVLALRTTIGPPAPAPPSLVADDDPALL
jgi:2-keto-4-pentenoate hydratase/2-oxohepta-3-ene-1,7-dioic acid hydratase in catechol pathway